MMVLIDTTLDPMAEFKKFTASLLTPTTRSIAASAINAINIRI
jgi:hypothetical protein